VTYWQLLKVNRDFRRLWIGQVISEIGDWLNNIAVLALTIEMAGPGREGLAIAVYAIARHLPLFLFGPIAGVVVDRTDRTRVMVTADVLRAVLALGFVVANRFAALPLVYVVGAMLFGVSAFFNAAKRASIPRIVNGPAELLSANSLSASTTAATIAAGSALGGVVATFVGRDSVFVINAATFVASALVIRRIRRTRPPSLRSSKLNCGEERGVPPWAEGKRESGPSQGTSWLTGVISAGRSWGVDFREGLHYVRGIGVLSAVFMVAAGWGLGNGVARALYSIFGARMGAAEAPQALARPTDFGISVLFVAMGIGGVLGAPIARRFNAGSTRALGSRMGRSMVFDGCGLALFSAIPSLWGAAAILALREMNFAIWWTAQQTIMMTVVDDRYSGRVFASYETLTTLMMVSSMLIAGAAADTYGIRPVAGAGGAVIACSGLLWFFLRRHKNTEDCGQPHRSFSTE
jgi:MFS family permease